MIWYELPESNNNRLIIWLKSSNIVIITSAIDTTKYSVDCAYFAEKSLDIKYVFTEIMIRLIISLLERSVVSCWGYS